MIRRTDELRPPPDRRTPPSRGAVSLILIFVLIGSLVACSPDRNPIVPVYKEPLHRLVLDRPPVRVLDVQLQPGDTSRYHLHEDPIFYVAIDISEIDAQVLGEEWKRTRVSAWSPGGVAHDLGHAKKPLTHRIRNVGDEGFRLMAVTNSGFSGPFDGSEADVELPGEIETDVEFFRQSRITLMPGGDGARFRSRLPVIIVQVSPGEAVLTLGDTVNRALTEPGSFVHVEPGRETEVRNSGDLPVTMVVVEAQ